jgi:hypothetical protein
LREGVIRAGNRGHGAFYHAVDWGLVVVAFVSGLTLRPLQEAAIDPILDGSNALLIAPTACKLWHGDVSQAEKSAVLRNPPDILLTTPESIEAMLVSTKVNKRPSSPEFRTSYTPLVEMIAAGICFIS